jgi:hypothetical protein
MTRDVGFPDSFWVIFSLARRTTRNGFDNVLRSLRAGIRGQTKTALADTGGQRSGQRDGSNVCPCQRGVSLKF